MYVQQSRYFSLRSQCRALFYSQVKKAAAQQNSAPVVACPRSVSLHALCKHSSISVVPVVAAGRNENERKLENNQLTENPKIFKSKRGSVAKIGYVGTILRRPFFRDLLLLAVPLPLVFMMARSAAFIALGIVLRHGCDGFGVGRASMARCSEGTGAGVRRNRGWSVRCG